MSVPFSNTHLRVPHGFGTVLEGLTREILRDQPEDIPKYAAQYFETLLKQREESGMDPAEWAAKLEDRFYNNHAFKTSSQPIPEEETTTDVTSSIQNMYDFQTEDDSSKSAQATTEPIVTEELNLTESTEEEEEKDIMSLERKLSQERLDIILSGADVKSEILSESEEETNPAINKLDQVDRESIGSESKLFADQSGLESTDFLLFDGTPNVDVCAQELETTEDQEDNKQKTDVNEDISNSEEEEENTEVEEPVEVFPYSGLADVDVCATELGEKEKKLDRATDENDAHGVEDTAARRGHIMSGIQDDELQMEEAEKEVNLEEEHMEIHHDASEVMKRKMDSNDSDLNYSDDGEKREGVQNISSSYLPTTEEDEEKPETEIDHKNEETESISDGELHQNPDFEEQPNLNDFKDETTEAAGEDKWDIHTEGFKEMEEEEINDSDEENALSTVTLSNVSTAPVETEGGTFEASAQHLPEENDEIQESHPEDTMVQITSKEEEELAEEEADDTEIQEKMYEDKSISLPQRAGGTDGDNQEEEIPLESEKATTEPESKSIDMQEECSRPQEEEDIMDIPLDDPEANRAAAKIQAGFRGHMTRKKMKPEDKAEGEEVSSTGDVLNGSQGDTETGGSGAVERDDTSVPEQ